MKASGQERRIGAVRNISALPPRADVGADIVERPLSAKIGREQMQQKMQLFDHFVGEQLDRIGHLKIERPGRLQVDDEFEFSRL
jgi:hypothetical protein